MIPYEKLKKTPFGGDYNPEQWPPEVWEEDMRLFREAHIDTVTLNVFSWALIQKDETTYDFSMLDRIMDLVTEHGLNIILATSTAAHPAWMAHRYPDILRTEFDGRKRRFGGRHNSCPNSPTYRKYGPMLAKKLAERYHSRSNLLAWHISNEYGGECFCENCQNAFRIWLKKTYHTLEQLNQAWNTTFWGHTFYDWEEIVLPDLSSEHLDYERTMFQGISLDYRRFMSDSMLECFELEKQAIVSQDAEAQVTTNLMGFYKQLDYQKWSKSMDFVSWDNYPSNGDSYSRIAMSHDLMRGIGGGAPFALMEQTPGVTNWLSYNPLKRPGVMRLWSYQAMAHGADTVLFFQMRRSIGACEKYHSAVIDHAGTSNTRVFREISTLGAELEQIGPQLFGSRTCSKIAILMNWDNWWSIEYSAGPSCDLKYRTELERFYCALRSLNYNVDLIAPEDDFSGYRVVIAPVLYMVKRKEDGKIREYVKNGGTFLTTFFSGYVQENDLVTTGGYPGKLRDILGIWVEEEDALPADAENSFIYRGKTYPAILLCDLIHPEGAEQIDENGYGSDFYQGMPVITRNRYGKGSAWYLACASSSDFYQDFLQNLMQENQVEPVMETPKDVEVTSREKNGTRYLFVMNHAADSKTILIPRNCEDIITGKAIAAGELVLEAKDVRILKM